MREQIDVVITALLRLRLNCMRASRARRFACDNEDEGVLCVMRERAEKDDLLVVMLDERASRERCLRWSSVAEIRYVY